MKLPLLSLAALFALGASFAAPDGDVPATAVIETATHTVQIQYHDRRGLWRRATVSLRMGDGSPTPWSGRLQELTFDGLRPAPPRDAARAAEAGYPLIAQFNQSETLAFVPAPENLKRLWLKGERGSTASIRIWTDYHNPSTYGDDDGDGEDPPKDPPSDDPPDDDEPAERDCPPIPPGCEIYNPFKCECSTGLRDPWGDATQIRGSATSFSF